MVMVINLAQILMRAILAPEFYQQFIIYLTLLTTILNLPWVMTDILVM